MAEQNLLENGRLVYAKSHVIPGRSGLMTGIAADAAVWALRNIGSEELIVSSVFMAWLTTTAFTAAQGLAFGLYKATAFTAIPTGGITPNPTRKRVGDHIELPTTQAVAVISNAAALTGSSFTVDADDVLHALSTSIAVASAAGLNFGETIWKPSNKVPLSLGADEGLIIRTQNAMGAGGVGRLFVAAQVHLA